MCLSDNATVSLRDCLVYLIILQFVLVIGFCLPIKKLFLTWRLDMVIVQQPKIDWSSEGKTKHNHLKPCRVIYDAKGIVETEASTQGLTNASFTLFYIATFYVKNVLGGMVLKSRLLRSSYYGFSPQMQPNINILEQFKTI